MERTGMLCTEAVPRRRMKTYPGHTFCCKNEYYEYATE